MIPAHENYTIFFLFVQIKVPYCVSEGLEPFGFLTNSDAFINSGWMLYVYFVYPLWFRLPLEISLHPSTGIRKWGRESFELSLSHHYPPKVLFDSILEKNLARRVSPIHHDRGRLVNSRRDFSQVFFILNETYGVERLLICTIMLGKFP